MAAGRGGSAGSGGMKWCCAADTLPSWTTHEPIDATDRLTFWNDRNSTVVLLVLRAAQANAVVVAVELLTHLPVVVFCFLTLLFGAATVCLVERPVPSLAAEQWMQVLINGGFLCVVWLLWSKGLQECGALRTVILDHAHICVVGLLGFALGSKGEGRQRSLSGEAVYLGGLLFLLYHSALMTDESDNQQAAGKEPERSGGPAIVEEPPAPVMEELGLFAGLLMLMASSLLGAVRRKFAAKVSRNTGGARALHALSLFGASVLMLPLVLIDLMGEAIIGADYDYSVLSAPTMLHALIVAVLLVASQYSDEALGPVRGRAWYVPALSLVVSFLVTYAAVTSTAHWYDAPMDHERHMLPIWISWAAAVAGLLVIGRSHDGNKLDTLGGSSRSLYGVGTGAGAHDGLFGSLWRGVSEWVLHNDADDNLGFQPKQLLVSDMDGTTMAQGMRRMYRHVMSSPDSKKIAVFLLINLAFMFVEVVVGLWTNSLGLISDAGHMLFDCMALFIGLFASFVSKWKANRYYTYGYGRYETLCGFVNGIFLVFIAVFIMTESIERISEPPELSTSGLLATSVAGFFVNMIGLVFFHDHAHMGGGGSGGAHGHSHGGGSSCDHGHSHGNDNLHGVFLHILADTLGSLGVIVSSLLIEYKEWYVADPLCSFMISVLILMSVGPLLRSTANSLLLVAPDHLANSFTHVLQTVSAFPEVVGIREPHLWAHVPGYVVVDMHVITTDTANNQAVLRLVGDVIRQGVPEVRQITVQTYNESCFRRMLDNKGSHVLPLFWSPSTESFTFGTGLPEGQASQPQKHGHGHHGHSHDERRSHGHHHGHSHHGHGVDGRQHQAHGHNHGHMEAPPQL